MNKITKTTKVPFHKINFKASFAEKEQMNELETLIMILIVSANDLGFKKQTLREAIEEKYGVKNHTMDLVGIALSTLIRSKTIPVAKDVLPEELLDTNVRRVSISVDKDIASDIKDGRFFKKSIRTRKVFGTIYENVIPGTVVPGTITETKYDNAWKADGIEKPVIEGIGEDKARSMKHKNETLSTFQIVDDETKIVYLDSKIEFNKEGPKIVGSNKLFKIILDEIEHKKLAVEDLTKMLDTSLSNVDFSKEEGIPVENLKLNSHTINGNEYIEHNNAPLKLFNKKVTYEIEETGKELTINEIFASNVDIKDFAAQLVKQGDVSQLDSFNQINNQLKDWFLDKPFDHSNEPFIRHYFDKETFESKIGQRSKMFVKLYDEVDLRTIFQSVQNSVIENNLPLINTFIEDNKANSLYKLVYLKLRITYKENTVVFPKWDKEVAYNKFIKELSSIENKIKLIVVKKDAEDVLELISKYAFAPIDSSIMKQLEVDVKKMLLTCPVEGEEKLKFYGAQVRIMLESLISKKDSSETFSNQLKKQMELKLIKPGDKSQIMSIYKRSNEFHHNSGIKYDSSLETQIKKDIINVLKIANNNKVSLKGFGGEQKWATV